MTCIPTETNNKNNKLYILRLKYFKTTTGLTRLGLSLNKHLLTVVNFYPLFSLETCILKYDYINSL